MNSAHVDVTLENEMCTCIVNDRGRYYSLKVLSNIQNTSKTGITYFVQWIMLQHKEKKSHKFP